MKALSSKFVHQELSHNNLAEDYYRDVSKVPEKLGIIQKDLGAFYTEKEIVSYVLQHLEIKDDTTILDPSCGCGSFLFPLYYMAKFTKKPSLFNIYGVDIDERAVSFTRNALKSIFDNQFENISTANILLGDFVFNEFTLASLTSETGSSNRVMSEGGFDYIIGNPPYNVKNATKKKVILTTDIHRKIAYITKNMPIYFILKSIELLKKGGTVIFVLPKSLLYVKRYSEFREYILKNFTITKIAEIGMKFKGVRGEQVIVFIRNSPPGDDSQIEFESLSNTKDDEGRSPFLLPQRYFLNKSSIPVFSDPDVFKVVDHINHISVNFSNFAEYKVFRGVSIGIKRFIDDPSNLDRIPSNCCVRGRDLAKGRIRRLGLYTQTGRINLKISELRRPKIVMQNIYSSESGIISYLDKRGIISTETVTNVFISDPDKLKFFYALLNSKLINFYLFNAIFCQSRLTMHLDGHYISQIPTIWKDDSNEIREILRIADQIEDCHDAELKRLFSKIDTLVYNLFGLNSKMIEVVENTMSKVLSERSKW